MAFFQDALRCTAVLFWLRKEATDALDYVYIFGEEGEDADTIAHQKSMLDMSLEQSTLACSVAYDCYFSVMVIPEDRQVAVQPNMAGVRQEMVGRMDDIKDFTNATPFEKMAGKTATYAHLLYTRYGITLDTWKETLTRILLMKI